MITASVQRLSSSADDVEIRIIVISTEGFQIGEIAVFDRGGGLISSESIPDCTDIYEKILTISQRLLPLRLRVRRCVTGIEEDYGPFEEPDSGVVPCDPSTPYPPPHSCQRALDAAQRLSAEILNACGSIGLLEDEIIKTRESVTQFLIAAAAFLALAAGVALLGPLAAPIAGGLALVAVSLAAFGLLYSAHLYSLLARRSDANRQLRNMQGDFATAAAEVRQRCCPHEITFSLNTPSC